MNNLKVCFVGVGSIAGRHMSNLSKICKNKGIELHVDAVRRNGGDVEGVDMVYSPDDIIPDDYDVIFITNPTSEHLKTLKRFHDKGKHFFIEKPAVSLSEIKEAEEFRMRDDSVYYVAGPLRYNAVIQYIREHISIDGVISVRSISSSYLPDWRPRQDYRKSYSAHRDLGGGVSIDLIHEWDYLSFLFGFPDKVSVMTGKKSSLEIDSDDYAIYIAEYDKMIAELHLDYFGRKTIREVQLFTKDDTIIGDILNNRIRYLRSGKEIDFNEERDDYQRRELEYFIDLINTPGYKDDHFHQAIKVLKLTQGICN